jgi:hypothetical protein
MGTDLGRGRHVPEANGGRRKTLLVIIIIWTWDINLLPSIPRRALSSQHYFLLVLFRRSKFPQYWLWTLKIVIPSRWRCCGAFLKSCFSLSFKLMSCFAYFSSDKFCMTSLTWSRMSDHISRHGDERHSWQNCSQPVRTRDQSATEVTVCWHLPVSTLRLHSLLFPRVTTGWI